MSGLLSQHGEKYLVQVPRHLLVIENYRPIAECFFPVIQQLCNPSQVIVTHAQIPQDPPSNTKPEDKSLPFVLPKLCSLPGTMKPAVIGCSLSPGPLSHPYTPSIPPPLQFPRGTCWSLQTSLEQDLWICQATGGAGGSQQLGRVTHTETLNSYTI